MILDSNGMPHSLVYPHPNLYFWDRVLRSLTASAYYELIIWTDLLSQIEQVISLREKHASQNVPEKDLPANCSRRFSYSLSAWKNMLLCLWKNHSRLLRSLLRLFVRTSTAFRNRRRYKPTGAPSA